MTDSFAGPLSFEHPAALVLLAAPVIAAFARRGKDGDGAVPYPSSALLRGARATFRVRSRTPVLTLLSWAAVLLAVAAALRPVRATTSVDDADRRSVFLVLDVSRSMEARDFTSGLGSISRLDALKGVIAEFVRARPDDRIGLVVFGSSAFLQAPATLDHSVLLTLLGSLRPGVAGDGTAIGDGLGLALKRISALPQGARTVVLMTDGVSNSGRVSPVQAGRVAAGLGVVVHTVGVGVPGGGPGSAPGPDFDPETLRGIASATGGVYFHASSSSALADVYREIDRLESTKEPDVTRTVTTHYYPVLAFAAAVTYLAYVVLSRTYYAVFP